MHGSSDLGQREIDRRAMQPDTAGPVCYLELLCWLGAELEFKPQSEGIILDSRPLASHTAATVQDAAGARFSLDPMAASFPRVATAQGSPGAWRYSNFANGIF